MVFLLFIVFFIIVAGGIYLLWYFKKKPTQKAGGSAITLVEVTTVVIIIGSIGLAAVSAFLSPPDNKEEISLSVIAEERLDGLVASLTMYRFDILSIPSEEDGLEGLLVNKVGDSTWRGPYILNRGDLIDPWGRPFQYRHVNGRYEILSLGADNEIGGSGENRDLLRKE